VLDRGWLARRDPLTVAEAIAPVSGLRLVHMGDGVTQTVSIRGMRSDRVAVLVDGRPLNSAQGGGVDLSPLDLESVERIEITRGALSALYGPYALGGAVNLVRDRDRSPKTSVRLWAGSDSRALARVGAGFRHHRLSGHLSLRAETASPDLDGRVSHAEGAGGTLRLSRHLPWAAGVDAVFERRQDDRDVPGSRAFPSPAAARRDVTTAGTLSLRGARTDGMPGFVDASVHASEMTRRYRDPENPLGAVDDTHRNRSTRMSASWTLPGERAEGTLHVEGVRDGLESTTDGSVVRHRGAVAVSGLRSGDGWSVSASARADAVEDLSPRATVRASATRTLAGDGDPGRWLAVRAGGGTAFRPPTFDDLFWPARASAAGNPDLEPERAWDVDVGLELAAPRARAQVSAFHSRVDDLIQWTPGADGVWRPHNVSRTRIRGVEAEARMEGGTLPLPRHVDLSASRLDAADGTGDAVTGGKQLVGRAEWTAFAESVWRWGAVDAAVGVRAVSRTPVTAANTKWLDGYLLWHAGVRWHASPELRLDVEGTNLLDTYYEDIRGYATPGRTIGVGLRYAVGGTS
jgi:outer membrane cobalamin receptor